MNTSETATIIVHSTSVDFSYQGEWVFARGVDGTSLWQWPFMNVSRDTLMNLGGFTFIFEGFDAMFVGSSRQPVYSTFPNSTITIDPDSDSPLVVSFSSPDEGPYYLPWYRTPRLSYGAHRVIVTNCVNEMVNYVLVTVGRETALEGKTIFVDDADPQIHYDGVGWVRNNGPTFASLVFYTSMPAANTSMQTKHVGDSFELSFMGTSATVYGLLSWENTSSLVLQFDLDGKSADVSFPISRDHGIGEQINIPFMSYKNLSPSFHKLRVTVKEISQTAFRFDYVIYSPAFPNLASLYPTGNPNVVFTPAVVASAGGNENDLLLKIIVGSVLGGLALLAFAVGGLVCWNRWLNAQKINRRRSGSPVPGAAIVTGVPFPPDKKAIEPLTSPIRPDNLVIPFPLDRIPEDEPTTFPILEPTASATVSPYPPHKRPTIFRSNGLLSGEMPSIPTELESRNIVGNNPNNSRTPPPPNSDANASQMPQSTPTTHQQFVSVPTVAGNRLSEPPGIPASGPPSYVSATS